MKNDSRINAYLSWVIASILLVSGVILLLGAMWFSRDPASAERGNSSERDKIDVPGPSFVDAESLTIYPGKGIGHVLFGASHADIVNAFGVPSASKKSNGFDTMEYPELGFWVLCHDEKAGCTHLILRARGVFRFIRWSNTARLQTPNDAFRRLMPARFGTISIGRN